jgi:hypothetical protein
MRNDPPAGTQESADMTKAQKQDRAPWLRAGILCLLISGAVSLQGCLAVAWVGIVGFDSLRTSDLTFWPFEKSWVAPQEQGTDSDPHLKVSSVAVLPFEGDAEMGARLAEVLQQETSLRVERPDRTAAEMSSAVSLNSITDDSNRTSLARAVTQELNVDTVLVGRVAESSSHPSDWGWKEEEKRRLFLYLLDHDGHLLWKDELPFTITKGTKPPLETSVQTNLAHHLRDHVQELGLAELGYLPKKSS